MKTIRRMIITISALIFAVCAASAVPAAADVAPTAELCSAPEVFGSYALRACIEPTSLGARGYAYVSVKAGHSPCRVRGRLLSTGGLDSGLATAPCPSGAAEHVRYNLPFFGQHGTFFSAFSIERLTDGNIAPKAQSPRLTVP